MIIRFLTAGYRFFRSIRLSKKSTLLFDNYLDNYSNALGFKSKRKIIFSIIFSIDFRLFKIYPRFLLGRVGVA